MTASKSERLLNLVILLLVARRPVSKESIRKNIEEYAANPSADAFEKMFERDKEELRSLGLPIETGRLDAYFDDEVGYFIRRDAFELPEIDFAPEEVAVLGLAARVWQHAGLARSTSTALLKLRAAGHEVDRGGIDTLEPTLPVTDPFFDDLLTATLERREVGFGYRRAGDTSPTRRHLRPWSVVTSHHRWYVVGYDVDRGAERVFRLDRIEGPIRLGRVTDAYAVPEGTDAQELVQRLSPGRHEPMTATVLVRTGAATGLRRVADSVQDQAEPGWDRLRLAGDEGLASLVLSFGEAVRVEAPPELRQAVIDRLSAFVGAAQ